jgi:hypothetical protein
MGGVLPKSQSSGSAMVDLGIQTGMVKKVESSPTTAEVDQASSTDATGIKRRRRGRSPTILTGAAGVQEGATLGSPTLLG